LPKKNNNNTIIIWFHLHEIVIIVKFIEIENKYTLPKAKGKGEGGYCLMGTEFLLGVMQKVEE
jgi:hypothetical protein